MHKLCSITLLLLLLLLFTCLSCYSNYVFVCMTMGTGMWICFCFIIMKYTSDCEVKCDLDLFLIQSKSLCLAFRVWRLFSESRYLRRRSRAAVLHRSWSPCTTIWSRSSTPPATTSGRACCEPCAPVCLKSDWTCLAASARLHPFMQLNGQYIAQEKD